jgi:hypothetical protein
MGENSCQLPVVGGQPDPEYKHLHGKTNLYVHGIQANS